MSSDLDSTAESEGNKFKRAVTEARQRLNAVNQKLQLVTQGAGSTTDNASIHKDMKEVEATIRGLQATYKTIVKTFDASDARSMDDQMTYLRTKLGSLRVSFQSYLAASAHTVDNADVPEYVTQETMDLITKEKEEQIDELTYKVKEIGHVQNRIHEELDKGDEIMDELGGNVDLSKKKVDSATGHVSSVVGYIKKNKAPFITCLISFVLMIFVWSTRALCSIGVTYQCPRTK